MKRIILYLFVCLMSFSTTFSQKLAKENFEPKVENGKVLNSAEAFFQNGLTSILEQIWVPNNWEDDARTLFEYNDAGLPIKMTTEEYVNSEWVLQGDMTFEYDAQGQLVEHIMFYYDEGVVQLGTKWEYTNSGENISEAIISDWDVDGNVWEIEIKDVYEYSNGLKSKIIEYDYVMSSWDVSSEYTFTYNAQGLVIEELTQGWSNSENTLVNSYLISTSYNSNGNILETLSRSWNIDAQQWYEEIYNLSEYEYDNNYNRIVEIYTFALKFGDLAMITKTKVESQYDNNNYLIVSIDFTWDDISSQWLELEKSDFTNDEAGNKLEVLISSKLSGDWEPYEKHIYNYDGTVDVDHTKLLPTEFALEQNYPNPFNPETTISYTVNKSNNVELKIYDILGNYLTTLINEVQNPGLYNVNFNAADYSSGTYIYSIKLGNKIITKKCLLIK